jgi:DNA-binding MarR family transcriptional regulator
MNESGQFENDVYRFIQEQIESVPHLEALLLLWNSRPQPWTVENLAKRLYVSSEFVTALLQDLKRRELIESDAGPPEGYRYYSRTVEQDKLIDALDSTYRREVVRISTMIHSRASAPVRDFARAFRFTREKE